MKMHKKAGGTISPAIKTDRSVLRWHQDREASASVMEKCLGERFLACYKLKIVLTCH